MIHSLDNFLNQWRWYQGEHITVIAPTGYGKSTLINGLLHRRKYVIFLATKPQDAKLEQMLTNEGYVIYPEYKTSQANKIVVWPKITKPGDVTKQREVIAKTLDDVFVEGGWTLAIDELYYVSSFLGFDQVLRVFWTQARSLGISVLGCIQRPRDVPLLAYSQASHLFIGRFRDKTDLRRLSDIGNVDSADVMRIVQSLERYQYLYIDVAKGEYKVIWNR